MSTNAELTRERLGNALKEELRTTPLTKVTVRRLTEIAGVFEREIVTHIMAHATYREWSDGFCDLLVYMSEHREQTYAVVSSLSRSEIEEFFYRAFREMMRAIINELEGSAPLDPAQRDFIIDHFTLGVVAHLFHWLNRDMQADPFILTENIEVIMRGSVATALDRYSTDAPPPLIRREGKH